jgi:sugar (pentulose or hexulose) kinase
MAILVGVDLGTTKITAIAVDVATGELIAVAGQTNTANITSEGDRKLDRSEWDATQIIRIGIDCLRSLGESLGDQRSEIAAIGVTGQQHGVVLVDKADKPITPLINWQDRRALETTPEGGSLLHLAREHVGTEAILRNGCRLHPGFMAVTLFWLQRHGGIPASTHSALFIMDLFCCELSGGREVTEPTCAASSGALNIRLRDWDNETLHALGLPRRIFPEVVEASSPMGQLKPELAERIGFPKGTPIVGPLGDHQACFVGSVADKHKMGLVNVGTGAQAAVFVETAEVSPPVEVRPFPIHGNLQSNVGLAGGWAYQTLERFFRDVGQSMFGTSGPENLFDRMNELAAGLARGASGMTATPTFSGTRADPTVRGGIQGIAPSNFTAAHFCRSVIEGMARSLSDGFKVSANLAGRKFQSLAAAGNGLRENALLAQEVEAITGLKLCYTRHREEAAFGAALVAGVATRFFEDLDEAGNLVRYE